MKKTKVYLTTPAYYPSANPHIGNAYCTVLVDVLARYFRLAGYDTYFITGTDEHGAKIAKNAKNAGKTPIEFVDEIVAKFKNLWSVLNIQYDDFIRTTEQRHVNLVRSIFSDYIRTKNVSLGNYEGSYCVFCESFWSDSQIGTEKLCPDCGRPVAVEKEEVYFFNTKKYVPYILELFNQPSFLLPEHRKNEMLNSFIRPGLEDLSVTRTTLDWGVSINEDDKHVVYVWLDALINYLSVLNYRGQDDTLFRKYWAAEDSRIIHIVGADINRFHSIYWPMFLKGIDLRAPDEVFVHGLIMTKDGKMSKSKGNVINPIPLADKYSADALRFYLVREMRFGDNGQFTPEQFTESINRDLVNNFGNLLNRSLTMIGKYCGGVVPNIGRCTDEIDRVLHADINEYFSKYNQYFEDLKPTEALVLTFELIDKGNKYIEEKQPWVLFKDAKNKRAVEKTMANLAYILYVSANMLAPFIPSKAESALLQLGLSNATPTFKSIGNKTVLEGIEVKKGEVLFPRLDVKVESDYIRDLMEGK